MAEINLSAFETARSPRVYRGPEDLTYPFPRFDDHGDPLAAASVAVTVEIG